MSAPVQQAAPSGWQPIDTAPKDGTEVLLYLRAPWAKVEKACWFDLWENWQRGDEFPESDDEYCGIGSEIPTHWMPLPAPPCAQLAQPDGLTVRQYRQKDHKHGTWTDLIDGSGVEPILIQAPGLYEFRTLYTAQPLAGPSAIVTSLQEMVDMIDSGGEPGEGSVWHTGAKAAVSRVQPTGLSEQDKLDAARWRALLASARIRILGSAGIDSEIMPDGQPYNGYAHFGMEIWTKYGASLDSNQALRMQIGNAQGRDVLTKYADIAIRAAKAGAA